MPIEEFDTTTLEQLRNVVETLRPYFKPATIFLLSGSLGVGKTEFVKAVVKMLLNNKEVSSPTFALSQTYTSQDPQQISIEHWDLYRLHSQEDLDSTGFWDQFQDKNKIMMIEWPERINKNDLPMYWHIFECEFKIDSGKRNILFKKP
jgi:tRNA threonylcarbamoyladenosine biosynthesis protein TsaE